MTTVVHSTVGEKLTMQNTTKAEAYKFLARFGVRKDHISKVVEEQ